MLIQVNKKQTYKEKYSDYTRFPKDGWIFPCRFCNTPTFYKSEKDMYTTRSHYCCQKCLKTKIV